MTGAAVIIGASGGIGRALADAVEAAGGHEVVHRVSRSADGFDTTSDGAHDVLAGRLAHGPPLTLVLVATGVLSDGEHGPERGLKALEPEWLARQYAVNTIGPALALKTLTPLMPRDRPSAFGLLSAKVGSISDNGLGGWYGYRASKAALNQMVRTASVELARTHPQMVVAALHPGTVRTELSAPFTSRRDPDDLFTPNESAAKLLAVLAGLSPAQTGRLWSWNGTEIAP